MCQVAFTSPLLGEEHLRFRSSPIPSSPHAGGGKLLLISGSFQDWMRWEAASGPLQTWSRGSYYSHSINLFIGLQSDYGFIHTTHQERSQTRNEAHTRYMTPAPPFFFFFLKIITFLKKNYLFNFFFFFFFWLHRVIVAACRIFCCGARAAL